MAMTMKVYEVDRYGNTVRVVQPETEVVPLERPESTDRYPACECAQCKGQS
ncbi:hypothetical protein [Streptomyces sp. B1I3]|uniref:hypothetical protein n=1 Tax=Streptomyces sp. B1I3 TaxID=3042264 RepID=UPI00277E353B|nr:hypothetical protein [Streptomyces sp. B1I3]MDQ0795560.1 hypothetical protein [Streptomyces sp. B1I3]